mgnify:CR=1 FL=1
MNQLLAAAGWGAVGAAAGWFVRWGSVRLAKLEGLEPGSLRWQVGQCPCQQASAVWISRCAW